MDIAKNTLSEVSLCILCLQVFERVSPLNPHSIVTGGGGYLESYGDFNHTTNKFAFSGLSLYGLAQWNKFDIAAD